MRICRSWFPTLLATFIVAAILASHPTAVEAGKRCKPPQALSAETPVSAEILERVNALTKGSVDLAAEGQAAATLNEDRAKEDKNEFLKRLLDDRDIQNGKDNKLAADKKQPDTDLTVLAKYTILKSAGTYGLTTHSKLVMGSDLVSVSPMDYGLNNRNLVIWPNRWTPEAYEGRRWMRIFVGFKDYPCWPTALTHPLMTHGSRGDNVSVSRLCPPDMMAEWDSKASCADKKQVRDFEAKEKTEAKADSEREKLARKVVAITKADDVSVSDFVDEVVDEAACNPTQKKLKAKAVSILEGLPTK